MKLYVTIIAFSLLFLSCKNDTKKIAVPITSYEDEIEMKKWDSIYKKFQELEIKLYNEANKKPEYVISKIDSLLIEYKNDRNINDDLHYFKAEVFYNLGKYENSIEELRFQDSNEIALVCNYVKLKKIEKAKSLLDSVSRNDIGFEDFIYANYYEVISERNKALEVYQNIQKDKSSKRFFYYRLAIYRIVELKKRKPKLLNGIYFPTGRPDFKENIDEDDIW